MDYIRKGIKNHIDHWGYEKHYCPGCGVQYIVGQNYCSECGRKLGKGADMESYELGVRKATGHRCEECRYYREWHCSNQRWRGSRNNELIYGDKKYTDPKSDACVLYDGEEEYEEV